MKTPVCHPPPTPSLCAFFTCNCSWQAGRCPWQAWLAENLTPAYAILCHYLHHHSHTCSLASYPALLFSSCHCPIQTSLATAGISSPVKPKTITIALGRKMEEPCPAPPPLYCYMSSPTLSPTVSHFSFSSPTYLHTLYSTSTSSWPIRDW